MKWTKSIAQIDIIFSEKLDKNITIKSNIYVYFNNSFIYDCDNFNISIVSDAAYIASKCP